MFELHTFPAQPTTTAKTPEALAEVERRLERVLDRLARTSYRLPHRTQLEALTLFETAESELHAEAKSAAERAQEADATLDALEELLIRTL